MSQFDASIDLKINFLTVTYISWSIDFALKIESLFDG